MEQYMVTSSNNDISCARNSSSPLSSPESLDSCSEKELLSDFHMDHPSLEEEDPKFGMPIKPSCSIPDKTILKDSAKSIQTYLTVIDGNCVDTIKQYYQINKDEFIEFLLLRTERRGFREIEYFLPEKYTTEKYLRTTGCINDSKRLFTLLYCQWASPLNNAEMFQFLEKYVDTTNIVLIRIGSGRDDIIRSLIHFNLPEETNLSYRVFFNKRAQCYKLICDRSRAAMPMYKEATFEKVGLERNMLNPITNQGKIALPVADASVDDDNESTKIPQMSESSAEERPLEEPVSTSSCDYSNVIPASGLTHVNSPILETSAISCSEITQTSTCEGEKKSCQQTLDTERKSSYKKPKRADDTTNIRTGKLKIVCRGFGGKPCGMKFSRGLSQRVHNLTCHREFMRFYCEYCGMRFSASKRLSKHEIKCHFKNSLKEDPTGKQYIRIWQAIVSHPRSRKYIEFEGHELIVDKWLNCDKKGVNSLVRLVPTLKPERESESEKRL